MLEECEVWQTVNQKPRLRRISTLTSLRLEKSEWLVPFGLTVSAAALQ